MPLLEFKPSILCVLLSFDRFKSMYHPSTLEATKTAAASYLCSRVDAFLYLMEKDWFSNVFLSFDYNSQVVRIMDAGI